MFQQKKKKKDASLVSFPKKQYQTGLNRALMGQPKARLHWASCWAAFVGLYGFT